MVAAFQGMEIADEFLLWNLESFQEAQVRKGPVCHLQENKQIR